MPLYKVAQRTPYYDLVTVVVAAATIGALVGTVMIGGASSTAITLSPPSLNDNGVHVKFIATTAQAHVVTVALGFNAKGSSGTATWTAAIGNSLEVIAYNGIWYTIGTPRGVTIA